MHEMFRSRSIPADRFGFGTGGRGGIGLAGLWDGNLDFFVQSPNRDLMQISDLYFFVDADLGKPNRDAAFGLCLS